VLFRISRCHADGENGRGKALDAGPSGIEVAYERSGDPGAPPVLLIMGAGAQMITWPEGFCAERREKGRQARAPRPPGRRRHAA
jgi:pimeloyl-ACP methyl ester carboxylesterase